MHLEPFTHQHSSLHSSPDLKELIKAYHQASSSDSSRATLARLIPVYNAPSSLVAQPKSADDDAEDLSPGKS